MGELADSADVAVIGGGPAGYVAAIRLAQLGKSVTVVEREALGGLCLMHGCIPSKALIHAATLAENARGMGKLGITASDITIDWAKTAEWKSGVVRQLNQGVQSLFKSYGVEAKYGTAYFESPTRVGIASESGVSALEFETAIIATGASYKQLPGFEFDGTSILSSRDALALAKVPSTLGIIGAGYVGMELASIFARVGSRVTVIEAFAKALPSVEREAADIVVRRMQEMGVAILSNTKPLSCVRSNGSVALKVQAAEGSSGDLNFEKLIVAVGHKPNTEGLRLQNAGVAVNDAGFIHVNERLRTNVPNIYAIGDVAGHPMLAHKASAQGRVAAEVIAGRDVIYDKRCVPAVVYTTPEIASVGLQEEEARLKGIPVVTGKFPFRALGRALASNAPGGFVKLIADAGSHAILGALIVSDHAGELIAECGLAVESQLMLEDIAATVHAHPTFAEAVAEAADAALGHCIHLPKKKE